MTFATSQQALEFLANDTPERYHSAARKAAQYGVLELGASLSALYFVGRELRLGQASPPAALFATAVAGIAFGQLAKQQLSASLEYLAMSRRTGAGGTTYRTPSGSISRQLLAAETQDAIELIPFHDVADIPLDLPAHQLGAINAVTFPAWKEEVRYSKDGPIYSEYPTLVATRFGPAEAVTTEPMERSHDWTHDTHRFVLARREANFYWIHQITDAVSLESYQERRRKPQPTPAAALELAPIPIPQKRR